MRKKLLYLIVPNHLFYEKYKNKTSSVFKDKNAYWSEVPYVSGYWNEIDERSVFDYKTLMLRMKTVMEETSVDPCDYNKERLYLYSMLYYELRIGETLFVQYVYL